MGSSNAFKGSGGKAAADLRDAIADWLDDASSTNPAEDGAASDDPASSTSDGQMPYQHLDPAAIAPIVRLWGRGSPGGSATGTGHGGAARGNGGSGTSGGGRSSGGVQRTVRRVAGPAGRAGAIASAYARGDRDAVEAAGLNYDDLRRLNDPLEVGNRIAAAAFEAQPDGSIEDQEARWIVADIIAWILEAPDSQTPEPEQIVRHSIELMIERSVLTEVGDTIRKEKNPARRREAEADVRRAAGIWASQVQLGNGATSPADLARAIEDGVDQLVKIYGEGP
jgi:hypothetical protein